MDLAAGNKAHTEGFGVILVQFSPNSPPTPLAPVFYCPQAPHATLSPPALRLFNKFPSVILDTLNSLSVTFRHKLSITLSTSVHNNLDFLKLPIMHFSHRLRTTPKLASLMTSGINEQLLHQRFDHRDLKTIIKMKNANLMDGLPTKIIDFHDSYRCPICALTKATRLPTHKHATRINHLPGDCLAMDFSFWNVKSIRGFTSLLSVVCITTRFSFAFPSRNKRPPLATIRWLIIILRKQGFKVIYIQTDEGGELGRSTEFLKLLTSLNCTYFGTGKSGSALNGTVERPNRTIAEAVRAKLYNCGLADTFWCFAAEDAVFKHRRILHTGLGTTPYKAWFGTNPHYDDMKIFGSHVYIVDTDVTRQKLDNRTFLGYFLKFSSTTRVIVYYNPHTKKTGRASDVYFDELNVGLNPHHPSRLGTELISTYPDIPDSSRYPRVTCDLTHKSIFDHPIITYDVLLPPIDHICPIKFYDDDIFSLPYIKTLPKNNIIRDQLPENSTTQQFLLSLNAEEPIHADSAMEEFTRLRSTHANKTISITLSKRNPQITKDSYETQRTKFDQIQPVIASGSFQPHTDFSLPLNSTHTVDNSETFFDVNCLIGQSIPTISFLTHSVHKPSCPSNALECFQPTNPHSTQWKETAFEQYDKNCTYRVFTKPIPIKHLPDNSHILKSVLAPSVKATELSSIWKLGLRHCVNGKPLKGNEQYDPTFAPTVSPLFFRFQLCYSAAHGFLDKSGDCSNAFQCTHEPDIQKRFFCYLPPFYFIWWNHRYPNDPLDPTDGPFVLQSCQNIQGTPHAANRWKKNLDQQLTKIGYINNNVDKAFYTKHKDEKLIAMLSTTVDDFYLSTINKQVQDDFFTSMSAVFDITSPKKSNIIDFLSLRIYHSEYGTSIDQTQHIHKNVLSHYFPPGYNAKIVDTPIRADPTYEYVLGNSLPLSSTDLPEYEHRYHGPFNVTIGRLLHAQQWTRPDLNYAISRLAVFLKAPTALAFEALDHLMHYLLHHSHEPIFYPSRRLKDNEIITYQWSKTQHSSYSTFGSFVFYSDSAFGNILPHRRSMQSNKTTLNGVIVDWSSNVQSKVAADSTDAEVTALYATCRKAVALRHFLASGQFPSDLMPPIIIFADNEAVIGLMKSNKLTYRSRHEDVPIAFCYENYLLGYYKIYHISHKLNAADASTKPLTGPILQRHWEFLRGFRFYPSSTTPHGSYLTTVLTTQTVLDSGK